MAIAQYPRHIVQTAVVREPPGLHLHLLLLVCSKRRPSLLASLSQQWTAHLQMHRSMGSP